MKPFLLKSPGAVPPNVEEGNSDLDGFPPELPPVAAPVKGGGSRVMLAAGLLFVVGAGLAAGGVWWIGNASADSAGAGSLRVESDPVGANVLIDGTARGKTPVTLSLAAGAHKLLVQLGRQTQQVPLTIERGTTLVHHISWATDAGSVSTATTGSLRVVTERGATARVSVDGVDRGSAPLTIADLTPGDHDVVVRDQSGARRRSVTIERGAMASLVLSATAPAGVASGWLSAPTSAPLQIFEDGRLVGSTESDRIMLPVGDHSFEFASQQLGFRTSRDVRVTAGQTATLSLQLPQAPMSVNATPWAQVWIDGQALGETPIGNVMQTIGSHQLIFRHPQLGERRVTAVVTLNEPTRVAVDMRK